jgi:integral membrane protein
VETAFKRYRIMSYVTGTTLLILAFFFILHSIDLRLWKSLHIFVAIVGIGHGVVLFPIYLVTCFLFVMKARAPLGLLIIMFLSGFVPGLAFYMEHRIAQRYGFLPAKGAP